MAVPAIATATPPITVTRSDGTTLSVPSPVVTALTNGVRLVGAREVVEASVLDTNFVQMLEHFASTTAPTTPSTGQLWYDLNAPAQVKVWDGAAWQAIQASGNIVDPANTLVTPGPTGTAGGGSGTSGSPYLITDTITAGTKKIVATITVSGLLAGQFVPISDENSVTNGSRFTFSNYFADSTGVLSFAVYLNDLPTSAGGTSYTCAIKIGNATAYVNITVAVISSFPLTTVNFPTDTNILPTSWTAPSDTLTPGGCIEISLDATTWVTNPSTLSIVPGNTLWTRWRGTAGSGTCIDSAGGTTISGSITASNGTSISASLTVDKTPDTITFPADTAQAVSSVTISSSITVSGINSYAYITGSITGGTNLEASVNGGAWTPVPVSGTSMSVINGQTLVLRLLNSASNSTTSTATLNIGTTTGIIWSSTTVPAGASVATPSITSPVNNATGINRTPSFTSSAYSSTGGAGSHASSDWEIASDSAFTTIIESTTGDTVNLTSFTAMSLLNASTDYWVRVRYTSNPTVVTSGWSTAVKFTTAAQLGTAWTYRGVPSGMNPTYAYGGRGAYANGKYVVGGANGSISTSLDGINWTTYTSATVGWSGGGTFYGQCVVWTGSKFYAVSLNSLVAESPDGSSWSSPANNLLSASPWGTITMTYASSKYITGGFKGYLAYSTDGVNWTTGASNVFGAGGDVWSVIWTGSEFLAIGGTSSLGYTITSADGITWNAAVNTFGSNRPVALARNGSTIVAVGMFGTAYYSTDYGVTWTSTTSGTGSSLYSVIWDGTQFIAAGDFGAVTTSPDGITWTYNNSLLSGTPGWSSYPIGVLIPNGGTQIVAVSSDTSAYVATSP